MHPYTPLEVVGRDIYIREGCYNCHSQMVRPFRYETGVTASMRRPASSSTTIRSSGARSAPALICCASAGSTRRFGTCVTWRSPIRRRPARSCRGIRTC